MEFAEFLEHKYYVPPKEGGSMRLSEGQRWAAGTIFMVVFFLLICTLVSVFTDRTKMLIDSGYEQYNMSWQKIDGWVEPIVPKEIIVEKIKYKHCASSHQHVGIAESADPRLPKYDDVLDEVRKNQDN